MRKLLLAAYLLWGNIAVAHSASDFVDVQKLVPKILLDIRYATTNNFMKQAVYPEARCVVRRVVGEALAKVQEHLKPQGLGLKIYDGYRPLSVQKKLWAVIPDEDYVANPKKGSKHNRGAAVDVTLVDASGKELPMPSAYDEFTPRAHRNFSGGSAEERSNRQKLEDAMVREGFIPNPTEWWHFDHRDWEKFSIEDIAFADIAR